MKKTIRFFLVVTAAVFMILPLKAQEPGSNIFKMNLFSPLVRTGSFFYERVLNEEISLQFGVFYTGASVFNTKFRGLGLTPELRYYLSESRPAPAGVYVAPYARYQSFSITSEEFETSEAKWSGIGGGLLVGYQTMLKKITLEGFIGPSYTSGDIKITSGDEEDFDISFFDGFGVRFGFTVGLAF